MYFELVVGETDLVVRATAFLFEADVLFSRQAILQIIKTAFHFSIAIAIKYFPVLN